MSTYQLFLDALSQLEQDQSLYEADVGGPELQGVQHEEIVKLGGRLCKRLKKFAEEGQTFAETLPPDFTNKLTDTIQSYQNLIVPPKIFGGFCPCLKPARSGEEYEKKMLTTKSKMVASLFVVQAVIIESRGEVINMNSMHYADYVNKMNTVFNSLADIRCVGSEKALENCRKKLLVSLEGVEKFISNIGDSGGKNDFQQEAKRRIRSTQELLTSRSQAAEGSTAMPLSARVLVKAQSSLQEIMNSAAAIALTEAKASLNRLEDLQKALKKARDIEVSTFNDMEERMHDHGLMEALHRLREDSEVSNSDAGSKLRDAVKRWTGIKAQSNARKVAEYVEETEFSRGVSNVLPGDLNPTKFVGDAKKNIGNAGKNAVNSATGVVNTAKNDFQQLLGSGANLANTGVMNVKNMGTKAVKGAEGLLGIHNEPTPPIPPPKTGLAKYNPIDAIMGNGDSDHSSSTKKKGKKKAGGGVFDGF